MRRLEWACRVLLVLATGGCVLLAVWTALNSEWLRACLWLCLWALLRAEAREMRLDVNDEE